MRKIQIYGLSIPVNKAPQRQQNTSLLNYFTNSQPLLQPLQNKTKKQRNIRELSNHSTNSYTKSPKRPNNPDLDRQNLSFVTLEQYQEKQLLINKISIQNYRNFRHFCMKLSKSNLENYDLNTNFNVYRSQISLRTDFHKFKRKLYHDTIKFFQERKAFQLHQKEQNLTNIHKGKVQFQKSFSILKSPEVIQKQLQQDDIFNEKMKEYYTCQKQRIHVIEELYRENNIKLIEEYTKEELL